MLVFMASLFCNNMFHISQIIINGLINGCSSIVSTKEREKINIYFLFGYFNILILIFEQVFDVLQPPLAKAMKIVGNIRRIFGRSQGPLAFYICLSYGLQVEQSFSEI